MKRQNNLESETTTWEMVKPKQKTVNASDAQKEQARETGRKCFRGPVSADDAALVRVNNQQFKVVDIGSRGVGIILPSADTLCVGGTVSIKLLLQGKVFSLQGEIMHITPISNASFLCGVKLININYETEQKLQAFLQAKRITLFSLSDEK